MVDRACNPELLRRELRGAVDSVDEFLTGKIVLGLLLLRNVGCDLAKSSIRLLLVSDKVYGSY